MRLLTLIFFFNCLLQSLVFGQKVKIVSNKGNFNYFVFLKDSSGRIIDTTIIGPNRPFIKNNFMYSLSINPNSKFNVGYSASIKKWSLNGEFQVIASYGFSLKKIMDVNNSIPKQSLMSSFKTRINDRSIVIKYGKGYKYQLEFSEENLLKLNSLVCDEIVKHYSPEEYKFKCE
jgi:hypothetical protein